MKTFTSSEVGRILLDLLEERTFCEQRNEYVVPQNVIMRKITSMFIDQFIDISGDDKNDNK